MGAIRAAKRESMEYVKECKRARDGKFKKPSEPRYHGVFSTLGSLEEFENFSLCGMYRSRGVDETISKQNDGRSNVGDDMYVHSKLCIVDGSWFTIGSANFVDISLIHDHSEINVCVFDEVESMKLMRTLANKHCEKKDHTFFKMTDVQIVEYMIKTARANVKRKASKSKLDGRLCALSPQIYGS